jgi:O-acetyl-ADP-ribose deacetylase (regulator of RNase III)
LTISIIFSIFVDIKIKIMEDWKLKYVKGDLVRDAHEYDVICHGCNCFITMGAGIAKFIKRKFPQAYEADKKTAYGDANKLGTITTAYDKKSDVTIINAYIQHHCKGRDVLVEYSAVRECMKKIKEEFSGKKIGLPKIGAGLAGGDFMVIENIIKEELAGEDVTIVIFNDDEWPIWVPAQ